MPSICRSFALLSWFSCAINLLATDDPNQVITIGAINFTVADQFDLEQVALEPLTKWPLVADWDSQGNLLVVESGGVGKPIAEHNQQQLHRIVRLTDRDHDGQFDERQVVADRLPFTEGVLAIGNDLLACAPPNIYRLSDENADGFCEKREIWFDAQTITGCANDLHGPYLGRDGWIYWCKGAFAEQTHTLLNGKQLKSTAAHIFRRRVTGGEIEPVMTGGMDNPVEVAITPSGERFFTSTFLQHPGHGLRDGIAHAIYGGVFGKSHQVLDGHVRTGPLMPIMTQLGPAAPSGLICLDSHALILPSSPQQSTLVAALFNLQKVTAHQLQANGASFTTANRDLVVADRIDFHPTDILEDSDGSLLIVDTGGWYDLCCPTSRIDQTTASGGIYRLSRKGPSTSKRPAGAITNLRELPNTELVQALHDGRPWIARNALLEIAKLSQASLPDCIQALSAEMNDSSRDLAHRLESLWALCAAGDDAALAAITQMISSEHASLAQAACHAVSLHRYPPAKGDLEAVVRHASMPVRRAAAEALGRLGDVTSIVALMDGLPSGSPDRALEHSITYALIELGPVEAIAEFATASQPPRQQQAAMTALDQLGAADRLGVDFMLAAIDHPDRQLAEAAAELLSKHHAWAAKFEAKIATLWQQSRDSEPLPTSLQTIARGWKDTATIRKLVGASLASASTFSIVGQTHLNQLLELYAGDPLPAEWDQATAEWLSRAEPNLREPLLRTLTRLNLTTAKTVQQTLLKLAKQTDTDTDTLRLQCLAALPSGTDPHDSKLESALLKSIQATDPGDGQAAALALQALQRIKLSREGSSKLLATLRTQSPRELAISVEAIHRLGDDELDASMLTLLADIPSARTLSMDQLLNMYRNRDDQLRTLAELTVTKLSRAPTDVADQVEATLANLGPGDPIRGLQLFRSSKTACSSCHRLGYVGGEVGPELTRMGASRTRRALLEAILFPSARLEQSYQPTRVLTFDGQVYNGLVKNTSHATMLELQLTADKSITLATSEIERQEPSGVSIMPAGMMELLSVDELADLLALLESGK